MYFGSYYRGGYYGSGYFDQGAAVTVHRQAGPSGGSGGGGGSSFFSLPYASLLSPRAPVSSQPPRQPVPFSRLAFEIAKGTLARTAKIHARNIAIAVILDELKELEDEWG